MRKYTNTLPLVRNIVEITSDVYICQYQGSTCLNKFILSRLDQPHMCIHCLKELDIIDTYKPKYGLNKKYNKYG